METVSVEKSAILGAISLCRQSILQFQQASKALSTKYQAAGSQWRDAKYQQLGGVVNECTTALQRPVGELEACMTRLNALLKAIEAYEANDL